MRTEYEFVAIKGVAWPVNTPLEIERATRELSKAGVNSVHVWKAYQTGHVLLADSNVDPVANGTRP
jgi:hypothetical protein